MDQLRIFNRFPIREVPRKFKIPINLSREFIGEDSELIYHRRFHRAKTGETWKSIWKFASAHPQIFPESHNRPVLYFPIASVKELILNQEDRTPRTFESTATGFPCVPTISSNRVVILNNFVPKSLFLQRELPKPFSSERYVLIHQSPYIEITFLLGSTTHIPSHSPSMFWPIEILPQKKPHLLFNIIRTPIGILQRDM